MLIAVFLLGTLLAVGLCLSERKRGEHEIADAFRADATKYYSTLRHEIDEAVNSGASVADLFHTLNAVGREVFRDFVVPHLRRAPGAIFLAWVPRVRAHARDRFETVGRSKWGPGFSIRDVAGGERKADPRAEYFPVYYRETLDGTDDLCFVGWDLGAVPASLEAIHRARDTGQPAMTARVKLATDANGVLVYWPIYEKKPARGTVAERRENLRGVIAVIFEIDRLMEYALGPTPPRDIDVSLADKTEPGAGRLLYVRSHSGDAPDIRRRDGARADEREPPLTSATMTLDVWGRRWAVTFVPTADYVGARTGVEMWLHLLLGLLVMALVGGYLLLLVRRTDQVERLVASRTHELRKAHDRLLSEVAERTRAEAAARRLSREALSIQEEERRRLSRELHDEAGQSLIGLALYLKLLEADVPVDQASLRQRLRGVGELANATAERMRMLARELRPPGLDTLGLDASLRGLCHATSRKAGVAVGYTGTDTVAMPDAVATCLYRVLQEALTNAVKHACATQIEVVLQRGAEVVALSVTDNGRGFNAGVLRATPPATSGIGLVGMRERVENLGGCLQINSRQGDGTCLFAQVPVTGEEPVSRPIRAAGAVA